nr:DUF6444 domain-containing protein [Methylomarinum sp. Ch1-1]MDP4520519.1 DUF6444 domain-containing protein [Methylomarinum sp. Ch1-1]MDP4522368.1 DUF6444 domain-containing protein [Methylomarinum sp. Ch1-1]
MQLSNQDLSQIDEDELLNLPEEELRYLSIKLLNDLKEARERLSQNSRNSSRPPSSEAPWDKAATDNTNDQEQTEIDKSAETEDTVTPRRLLKKISNSPLILTMNIKNPANPANNQAHKALAEHKS